MRILVVEDEPRLLRNLAKALREEGYAVDTAETGDDGLYKAESYSYDAIVLDVMLPRLDGWEVLERLRKQKPTPVLMLTARDAHKDRVRGLDTGADDYLVKPFDLTELLARLRALIRRSAGQARPLIELGDCVLAGRNIMADLSALRRFSLWLLAAGGTVLAFGLGGGWWLTTRAIRPVEEISAAASRISAGNLSERISVAETENELGRLAG